MSATGKINLSAIVAQDAERRAQAEKRFAGKPADWPARLHKLDELRTKYVQEVGAEFNKHMLAEREVVLDKLRNLQIDGMRCAYELSKITDKYFTLLAEQFLAPYKKEISLLFSGADGPRRETCPRSDSDIWFMRPSGWPDDEKKWPKEFHQCMSDFYYAMDAMSFAKNTSMRCMSVEDYKTEAGKEHETRTSLLEMRYIWGNRENFLALEEMAEGLNEDPLPYVKAHLAMMKGYRDNPAYAPYRLEPHIKNSYGGLRDLQGVRWMAKALLGCEKDDDLVKHGFLSWEELRELESAYNTLLTLRCHFQTFLPADASGRKEITDRLTSERQAQVAERFGVTPEVLMQRYYRAARTIGFYTDLTCAAIEEKVAADEKHQRRHDVGEIIRRTFTGDTSKPVPDGKGHITFGPYIAFDREEPPSAFEILDMFRTAQQRGLKIHHTALRAIYQNTDKIDETFRTGPPFRAVFMEILNGPDAEACLRQMQQLGVLQAFDPVMEQIDLLRQFDPNHIFTVDEHTFRSAGHLQKILADRYEEKEVFAAGLAKDLTESGRRILRYALYRHDACKAGEARGEITHPAAGRELALREGESWGLTREETEMAAWLIDNHLRLWHMAESMDLDEPETAQALARHIPSPEHLKLLSILTTADIMGEEQKKWDWYENALIKRLYEQADACVRGVPPKAAESLDLPAGYEPGATVVDLKPEFNGRAMVLTVIAPDHRFLFENLIGTITNGHYNIRQARADMRNGNGSVRTAVNSITFESRNDAPLEESVVKGLVETIRTASLADTRLVFPPPSSVIEKKVATPDLYPVTPSVEIANDVSDGWTFLKVEGRDKPGLVDGIATVFNNHGLDVGFLRVMTRGHKAVNSFKVRHANSNSKVMDEAAGRLYVDLMECVR